MTRNPDDSGPPAGQVTFFDESPAELFQELVCEAIAHQSIQPSEPAASYLVQLLTDFIDARRLFTNETGQIPTLLELLDRALAARRQAQLAAYRRLGDLALFVSGFFADSLNRKLVEIDYFVAMGGGAYGCASRLAPSADTREVFGELSTQFVTFMDVMGEVGEKCQLACDSDALLLQFYERYLRTGSARARRKLCEAGLLPIPGLDPRIKQ